MANSRSVAEAMNASSGGEGLGGQLPLQIVSSENMPDPVDQLSFVMTGFIAKCGQSAILLIGTVGDLDLPESPDRFAGEEAIPVDPEQFAQSGRITTIRLAAFTFFGLNENHFVAAIISQHANQPVVEPADYHHCNERFIELSRSQVELVEEL
ncbi:MAG TPA: hypothetical protein DD473_00770 [Planctomycetaceae bacterium]|nr:hypothetical protein [Planctomycetaceae bacterium]